MTPDEVARFRADPVRPVDPLFGHRIDLRRSGGLPDGIRFMAVVDGGPWQGPTNTDWVEQISSGALRLGHWPPMSVPWMKL